jgi:hypothetical protein
MQFIPVTTLTWATPWESRRTTPILPPSISHPPSSSIDYCPIYALGWSSALLRELADLVNDLFWCGFQPCWGSAIAIMLAYARAAESRNNIPAVWDGRGGDTLSVGVKTTHFEFVESRKDLSIEEVKLQPSNEN